MGGTFAVVRKTCSLSFIVHGSYHNAAGPVSKGRCGMGMDIIVLPLVGSREA